MEGNNKELLIIPGAVHTDLYYKMDVIPFDKIESFFKEKFEISTDEKIKLHRRLAATLPERFVASQSFSPYRLNSWAAIAWVIDQTATCRICWAVWMRPQMLAGSIPDLYWSSGQRRVVLVYTYHDFISKPV